MNVRLLARASVLALGTLWLAPAALAQEGGEVPPAEEPGPVQGPGFSRVIDDDETIYAIQRKAYLIKGKVELSLLYNNLLGDRFVATENALGVAGSASYHLSEQFALEAFGGYFNPTESETTDELLSELTLKTENAKLTQLLWAAGLGVQWSPIYGKLQLFDLSLGNFAFYFGAGAAIGQTRVRCVGTDTLDQVAFPGESCPAAPAATPDEVQYEPSSTRLMGTFNAGFRFRFLNWVGLKAEVRDYIFTSRVYREGDTPELSDSVRNNLYFQIGATFLLGGESN